MLLGIWVLDLSLTSWLSLKEKVPSLIFYSFNYNRCQQITGPNADCFCFIWTTILIHLHIVYGYFLTAVVDRIVATEFVWSVKPKVFMSTFWSFKEESASIPEVSKMKHYLSVSLISVLLFSIQIFLSRLILKVDFTLLLKYHLK